MKGGPYSFLTAHRPRGTFLCGDWHVRNVTLSMDEELIEKGREYARRHGISFNALIRDLLKRRITQESDWVEESFRAMDAAGGRSRGRRINRDELYGGVEVRNPFTQT